MSAQDNPYAFPCDSRIRGHDGMTLRDWFAGQAMAQAIEIIRNGGSSRPDAALEELVRCAGLIAYDFADAMLAAREQSQ